MSDLNVCRVCLDANTDEDMAEIFENGGKLAKEIFIISGVIIVELTAYDVPALICKNCVKELKIAIKFRTRVKSSDKGYFRNLTADSEEIWNEKLIELRTFEAPIEQSKIHEDIFVKCEIFENEVIKNFPEGPNEGTPEEVQASDHETGSDEYGNELEYESDYWPEDKNDEIDGLQENNYVKARRTSMKKNSIKPEKETPLQCSLCNKTLSQKRSYEYHMKVVHRQNVTQHFDCHVCYEQFPLHLALCRHLKRHHPNVSLDCDECSKKFSTHQLLENHKDIHHRILEYSCEYCGRVFTNRRKMQKHVSSHRIKKIDATFDNEDNEPLIKNEARKLAEDGVETVSKEDTEINDTVNDSGVTRDTGNECHLCQKVLRDKRAVEYHLKTVHQHNVTQMFRCGVCNKRFPCHRALCRHKVKMHKNSLPQCSECGRTFSTTKILENHMEIAHKSEHYCEICGKVFSSRRIMQKHSYNHQSRKPRPIDADKSNYSCDCCGKVFHGRRNFTRHQYRMRKKVEKNQPEPPPVYHEPVYNY